MAGIFVPGPSPIYALGYQDIQPQFQTLTTGIGKVAAGSTQIRLPPTYQTTGQPVLLGVGEDGVHIDFKPVSRPLMADIGGHSLPSSRYYDGQEATITVLLTIMDWALLEILAIRPNPNKVGAGATPGIDSYDAIGQPIAESGSFVQVLIRFPYQGKAAYGAMVPGYRFFQAYLDSKIITGSTKAARIPASFQCDRQYDGMTGKWNLYDSNISVLAPVVPGGSGLPGVFN